MDLAAIRKLVNDHGENLMLVEPATILALVAAVEAAQALDGLYDEHPSVRDGHSRAQQIAERVVNLHKALAPFTVISPTDRGRGGR